MKHTKGPWIWKRLDENTLQIRTKGSGSFREIARISNANKTDQANAELMAAAPCILEIINQIAIEIESYLNGDNTDQTPEQVLKQCAQLIKGDIL